MWSLFSHFVRMFGRITDGDKPEAHSTAGKKGVYLDRPPAPPIARIGNQVYGLRSREYDLVSDEYAISMHFGHGFEVIEGIC